MAYVDGFLIPVPTKNLAAYKKMSQKAGVVWMDHGALDFADKLMQSRSWDASRPTQARLAMRAMNR